MALLANTNVFASAIFVGASCQFMLEQAWSFGRGPVSFRPIWTRFLVPNLILLAGALLLVAQLVPIHLPGEPTFGRPVLHVRLNKVTPILGFLFVMLPALFFFVKSRGFPRIIGGFPALALVLIPTLAYACHERHAFMVVLGIVYFLWIYLDDIIAKNAAAQTATLVRATVLIILAAIAAQPGQIRSTFKADFDSTRTAQAIRHNHLDQADTVMVATEPCYTTAVLMQLDHIRGDYGPPPYPPGPMSFADNFYTRMLKEPEPTLEDIKPVVLKLAATHPDKTILVVACNPVNENFNDHDPAYQLVPIYASPTLPDAHWLCEFFQVYVLKR
jgi:hypothetical protein